MRFRNCYTLVSCLFSSFAYCATFSLPNEQPQQLQQSGPRSLQQASDFCTTDDQLGGFSLCTLANGDLITETDPCAVKKHQAGVFLNCFIRECNQACTNSLLAAQLQQFVAQVNGCTVSDVCALSGQFTLSPTVFVPPSTRPPTLFPTAAPTKSPTTSNPSFSPTTKSPTKAPTIPTFEPTKSPVPPTFPVPTTSPVTSSPSSLRDTFPPSSDAATNAFSVMLASFVVVLLIVGA